MRSFLLFLFSHHFLAITRWEIYFLRLRLANVIFGRNPRLYCFAKSRPQPRYLNFGSGPRGQDEPTWVNID